MNTNSIGAVIKATDVAKALGVTVKTVKKWIITGYVNGKKIGGRWYVDGDSFKSLLDFQEKQNKKIDNEILQDDETLRKNW